MTNYKDSGIEWIGQIPESWKLERLQWHLEEINEKNNPVKTTNILSLTNKLGVVPYSEKGNQGNIAKENYDQYKVAYPDTIVANSMNILIGSVGYCNYYGCVSPVYYVYKVKENNNIKFWNYVCQTEKFQKELRKYANGILEIRLRVSSDDILKRLVAAPSYDEQIKIADILDKKCSQIDALISIQQKEIEKLKEYKTSVITKAVTKGLDNAVSMKDSGIEWIGRVPESWEVCKIKFAVDNKENSFIDGDWIESQDITKEGIRYYTTGNVGNGCFKEQGDGYISEETFKKLNCKYAYGGDLILSRLNKPFGRSCIIPYNIEKCVLAVDIVILRPSDNFNKFFINYITQCPSYQKAVEDFARGTAMKRISRTNLSNIYIMQPPKNVQNEIVSYLDNICNQADKTILCKQQKIGKLQQYKNSLIYEYVTGKKEI